METSFIIQNLKCGGCKNSIQRKLEHIDGINQVHVDVETSEVALHYTNEFVLDKATHELAQMGYPLAGADNSTFTKAKSFVQCAIGKVTS